MWAPSSTMFRAIAILVMLSTLAVSQDVYVAPFIPITVCGVFLRHEFVRGRADGEAAGRLAGEQSIAQQICDAETNDQTSLQRCVTCTIITDGGTCNSTPNCQFVDPFCSFT